MQTTLKRNIFLLGSLLVIASAAFFFVAAYSTAAQADDSYYVMVFAAQRSSNLPRYSHTFATFVKATKEGTEEDDYKVEQHTISWIAGSLEVNLARVNPEPGVNLNLRDSLRLAQTEEENVSMWGPFEIKKELYDGALKQIDRLESGAVGYKAIDGRFRPESALNCIHAVADVDADNGLLETGAARGDEASRMVAEHLRRWMINPEKTHGWVAERLNLKDSSITRRTWED